MKTNLRKLLAWMLVLIMISADVCAIAATLELPKSLTIIDEEAFYGATSIDKVVVHDEVTEIRDRAFADSSITEINLPESIEYIADDAFDGCEDVAITAEEDTYAYDWCLTHNLIIDNNAEGDFEFFVRNDGTASISKYTGRDISVVIPETIKQYRVTSIDNFAFYKCTSLTTVSIPNSIIAIGSYSFYGCDNLKQIIIPESVVSIGTAAFEKCSSLNSVFISENVTQIPTHGFKDCTNLTSIQVPSSLQSIGNYAFSNCVNLTRGIFTDKLKAIGVSAFENCARFGENTEFVLPNSLEVIESRAFYNCTSLGGELTIPNSVHLIGAEAFKNCSGFVGELSIQNSNAIIEKEAFEGCTGITRRSIFAFSPLSENTCEVTGFKGLTYEEKKNMYSIRIPRYSPDGLKVTKIGNSAFRGLYIMTGTSVYSYAITIPEGVTTIGNYAFEDSYLDSVTLPSTLEFIGESAFRKVQYLNYIDIPNGVKLSTHAFAGSTLSYVELPNDLSAIPAYCFSGCSYLDTLQFPDCLESIGYGSLPGLTSWTVPASVTSIAATPTYYPPQSIYGYSGTAAETYAKSNGIKFYDLNEPENIYSVTFTVQDEKNTPIPNAEVKLNNYNEETITEGFTNENGQCTLSCIRDNEYYTVYVQKEGINFPDNGTGLYWTAIGTSDAIQVNGIHENRFIISGRITDENMAGIEGVEVKLWPNAFSDKNPISVFTDKSGQWSYSDAIANYNYFIAFEKQDYQFTCSNLLVSVAEGNTYVQDIIGRKLSPDLIAISGKIITAEGIGIEGITVSLSEATTKAHINYTNTNSSGEWCCYSDLASLDLVIHYEAGGYIFSDNDVVISPTHDITLNPVIAIVKETTDSSVSFMMNTPSIVVGDEAHFTVSAADYEWVRLIVDGIAYEKYPVYNGKAEVYRIFNKAGNRSVQFQGCTEDTWGSLSVAQIMEITSNGTLAVPEFSIPEQHTLGTPLSFEWSGVENAERYTVYLYHNGSSYVIDTIEAGADLVCEIGATYFQTKGQYGIEVIASGYGYSQNSCSKLFDVVSPDMSLIIETPLPSSDSVVYVAGDTFFIKVQNPDQKHVQLRITQPDGEYWYYPEGSTVNNATIETQYPCEKSGKYIIEAFGYVGTTMISPEYSIKNARVDITVTPSQITNVCVGNGYGNQLISGTEYIHAETNNAVEYVEVYEGYTLLATLNREEHCTEVDYVRTFTGSIPKAAEGKHTIRFEAYDSEGNMAKRSFTYYAVTDFTLDKVQYPISNGLKLLKYPDQTDVRKTLNVADALEVKGTYSELYFVKCGDVNGYVSSSDVFGYSPNDRANIGLEITSPSDFADYIGFPSNDSPEHKVIVKWEYDMLPENCYIMAGLISTDISYEDEPNHLRKILTTDNISELSFGLYELQGGGGFYNAVVSVYTENNKLLTRAVETVYVYPSYTEYYAAESGFDAAFSHASTDYSEVLFLKSAEFSKYAYDQVKCSEKLRELGFNRVKAYNYASGEHTVGYCIGEKTFNIIDGEQEKIYAIIIRGTPLNVFEWVSDFEVGTSGNHYGFDQAARELMRSFTKYIADGLSEGETMDINKCKLWITGHSRGAAVTNLVAAKYAGNHIGFSGPNIYAYTFACPNVAPSSQWKECKWIRNYNLGGDFVPRVPFEDWGFIRYGTTTTIPNRSYEPNITANKLLSMTSANEVEKAIIGAINSRTEYAIISYDFINALQNTSDSSITFADFMETVAGVSWGTLGLSINLLDILTPIVVKHMSGTIDVYDLFEIVGTTHEMDTYLEFIKS